MKISTNFKMLALALSAGAIMSHGFAQSTNVTFRVDMTQQTGFTTPEVNGTFNSWCGGCNGLTDTNQDGIWETTLPLAPGNYEFKFAADSWGSQENLTSGSPCTVTNGGFTNRSLTVGATDTILPVVCWGACTSCSAPLTNVTFRVNMAQQTNFTTPEVNGTFNGWCGAACNPMSDVNQDGIWEVTVALAAGSYEFKFAADNWTSQENLSSGSVCTVTNGGFTNRSLSIGTTDTILPVVCWGYCVDCNSIPTPHNVTFQVDMTQQTGFTLPEVNGTFNGWCGGCNAMSDSNGDGVWEATLSLQAGTYEFKYAADSWATSENLTVGDPCTITTGQFTNRTLVIGNADTTLSVVCWGSCSTCVTTGITEILPNEIRIYPNPSFGKFHIESKINSNIEIYNILGETILRTDVKTGDNQIDISSFPSGVYYLNSKSENGSKTYRIINK
jgi:1,4-alpha-glucan branching enzyme